MTSADIGKHRMDLVYKMRIRQAFFEQNPDWNRRMGLLSMDDKSGIKPKAEYRIFEVLECDY
jgi:hypothetical protein